MSVYFSSRSYTTEQKLQALVPRGRLICSQGMCEHSSHLPFVICSLFFVIKACFIFRCKEVILECTLRCKCFNPYLVQKKKKPRTIKALPAVSDGPCLRLVLSTFVSFCFSASVSSALTLSNAAALGGLQHFGRPSSQLVLHASVNSLPVFLSHP